MSTQVNAYSGVNQTGGVQGTKKMGTDALDMNDFMKLLAAQLSNQDVMNPMDNTAFIAQMAQFTSLQAMQTMSEVTYANYGASMIGKNVLVGKMDEAGKYTEDKGVIEAIKYAGGDCIITVNGKDYTLSSVMEILDKLPEEPVDPPDDTTKPPDGTTNPPDDTTKPPAAPAHLPADGSNEVNPYAGVDTGKSVTNDPDAGNSFGNGSPLDTEPTAQELFPMSPILFDPTI